MCAHRTSWIVPEQQTIPPFLALGALLSPALLACLSHASLPPVAQDSGLEERAKAVQAMGIICTVLTVAFFVVLVFLRNRIRCARAPRAARPEGRQRTARLCGGRRIAIAVVEDAAMALNDMKSLLIFPVILFFIGAVTLCVWQRAA